MGISARPTTRPTIRPAVFEDAVAVKNLHRRVGFRDEVRDTWPWLWTNNPVWAKTDPKPCIAWVLEAEGQTVGYLANIPLLCHYKGTTLVAAASGGFAVDQAYRGYGLLLAAAFFEQENVDIFLNTSASVVSASIYQRFKAIPIPQRDYDKISFWVLRPQPFMASVLRKAKLNSPLTWLASNLSAILLRLDIAVRRKRPRRKASQLEKQSDVSLIDVSEIGPEFDALWSRKIKEENRLLSYRTAETLQWHFAGRPAKVVCCRRDSDLVGYAVMIRDDMESFGLVRSKIVDLIAENNDSQVVDQLLESAYNHARRDGSHVLEVMGFPHGIRDTILRNRPYIRTAPNWPYYYQARDIVIQAELQEENSWYACPFDGDASL